ncbi:MAG: hypothetical protein JNK05_31800 [Myxococcales bacterium]|nr:hypothetical protein [Myxococcales bacterium]
MSHDRLRVSRFVALLTLAGLSAVLGGSHRSESRFEHTRVVAQRAQQSPGPRGAFHCFHWVHGQDFSTDCFRTVASCDRARVEMQRGHRDTTACAPVEHAYCTATSRPPAAASRSERCFGSAGNCERYRAYVRGNGLVADACRHR